MKQRTLLLLAVFAIALAAGLVLGGRLFGAPQPATLQQPTEEPGPPPVVAFEGIVRQASSQVPSDWIVDVYSVAVVSSTQVFTNGLAIEPGHWARVEALKLANGMQALAVDLQPKPTGDLFDRIALMDGDAGLWQVGNTQVVLGPDTTIFGEPQVGRLALVHGERSLVGISAESIEIVEDDREVVFNGAIATMTEPLWQVDDVTVQVGSGTNIFGEPEVGREVQVWGIEDSPRVVRAIAAWVQDQQELVSLDGWLIQIDNDDFPYTWRVNLLGAAALQPALITVDEATLVDDGAGPAEPGAWLHLSAWPSGASVYRAEVITVLPRAPKRDIIGVVEAMPPGGPLGEWQISRYRVLVNDVTGIIGTPEIGSLVQVTGTPDYANVYLAEQIRVLGF